MLFIVSEVVFWKLSSADLSSAVLNSHIMKEGTDPEKDMFLWITEAAGTLDISQVFASAIPTSCASSSHQQSTRDLSRSSWQHSEYTSQREKIQLRV